MKFDGPICSALHNEFIGFYLPSHSACISPKEKALAISHEGQNLCLLTILLIPDISDLKHVPSYWRKQTTLRGLHPR